ncbi:hypothetical protein HDU78_006528 [Chytriomyces hyalinus]|nr:hypothetical protein HDU78_006528 [Chytriomyces hyalinus]KAJ3253434.1 hypothetical protein HDU77_004541 [Chytriomyces hyalinus]
MLLIIQLFSLAILSHAQTIAGKGQPCGGGFQSGTTNAVCEAGLICTATPNSPGTYTCEPNVKENAVGLAGDACGGPDGSDCAVGLVCLQEGNTGVCRAIQNETESQDSGGVTQDPTSASEVASTGSVLQASESSVASAASSVETGSPAASTTAGSQSMAATGTAASTAVSSAKPATSMSTFATANIKSASQRDFMAFPLFFAVAISCIL